MVHVLKQFNLTSFLLMFWELIREKFKSFARDVKVLLLELHFTQPYQCGGRRRDIMIVHYHGALVEGVTFGHRLLSTWGVRAPVARRINDFLLTIMTGKHIRNICFGILTWQRDTQFRHKLTNDMCGSMYRVSKGNQGERKYQSADRDDERRSLD